MLEAGHPLLQCGDVASVMCERLRDSHAKNAADDAERDDQPAFHDDSPKRKTAKRTLGPLSRLGFAAVLLPYSSVAGVSAGRCGDCTTGFSALAIR